MALTLSDLPATVRRRRELPAPSARRQIRRDARITIPELSQVVGVSEAAMMAWEAGRREPRGANRDLYARALRALEDAA